MAEVQNSPSVQALPSEQYNKGAAQSNSLSIEDSPNAKLRVKQVAAEVMRTTKSVLHIGHTKEQIDHDEHAAPQEINGDTSFNPSQTFEVEAGTIKQIKNKFPKLHNIKDVEHVILHPKDTGEEQASNTLDASENPHLSREDDEKLINAHEKLKELQASDPPEFGVEGKTANLQESIDEMEDDRERKQVAWISSRYVSGVRVVQDQQYRFPFLSACRWVDESGEPQGAQWSQWIRQWITFIHCVWRKQQSPVLHQAASETKNNGSPEYDQDVLLQEVERIVISSSPIQRWISDLRKLRNWQNPRRTAFWLAVWLAIWTSNRVFTFLYLYSAYRVLQTRTGFDRRDSLKIAYSRAGADDDMTDTLSEMVSRYGPTKWLHPTIEAVGSTLQPKLRSVADWLEIFINFPEAKTGRATVSILSALAGAILIATLASTEVCVRAAELALILLFFVDKPLANRYPRYRSVIVPAHWVLWDVPTITEASFRHLRQRAREILKDGSDTDLLAAKCEWRDITGSVVLTGRDVRFVRSFPQQTVWRRRFEDIVEMRKGDGRTSLLKRVEHFIEFRFRDGRVERLRHLKKNDEAFNVIFAFSGLQWQQV